MTIQSFFTQNIQASVPAAGGKPAQGALGGFAPGLAFLDLFLSQTAAGGRVIQNPGVDSGDNPGKLFPVAIKTTDTVLQSDNPLLSKKPAVDLAELVAEGAELEQNVRDFITPTSNTEADTLEQTLVLNQQVFDNILKPYVTQSLPDIEPGESVSQVSANLKIKIEDILNLKAGESSPPLYDQNPAAGLIDLKVRAPEEFLQALVTKLEKMQESGEIAQLNLTPAQLTQVQKTLVAIENKEAAAQEVISLLETLLPAVQVTLLPPLTPKVQNVTGAVPAARDLPGGTPPAPDALPEADGDESFKDFTSQTKNLRDVASEILPKDSGKPAKHDMSLRLPYALPDLAASFPAHSGDGSLFATAGWESRFGTATVSAAPITGVQNLTHIMTSSQQVAQAHPGTQMVAATLQRAGAGGETKTLTLQLDPPELGRMQVRMEFGKDKSVKTVLTIEKPETLAMMQRDAHVLDKAMQDIGLDGEGGIDFQLADDGHNFGQDGGHDGSRGGYSGEQETVEVQLFIPPSGALYYDPETGLMRCDVTV